MKKHGFTLIELLAVLIVLAILAMITVPLINKSIKDSKEKAYQTQINGLIKSAKAWALDNVDLLPVGDKEQLTIYLITLKYAGYADMEIKNPKTGKQFPNDMEILITYDLSITGYRYEILPDTGSHVGDVDPTNYLVLLKGSSTVRHEIGNKYVDAGAYARDLDGNPVDPSKITMSFRNASNQVIADINKAPLGTYYVDHTAVINGASKKATRTLIIFDQTKPVISLNGSTANQTVEMYTEDTYTAPPVVVTDNSDVGYSSKIVATVVSNVTPKVPGTYTVTYSAVDRAGNQAKQLILTVKVKPREIYYEGYSSTAPAGFPNKDESSVRNKAEVNNGTTKPAEQPYRTIRSATQNYKLYQTWGDACVDQHEVIGGPNGCGCSYSHTICNKDGTFYAGACTSQCNSGWSQWCMTQDVYRCGNTTTVWSAWTESPCSGSNCSSKDATRTIYYYTDKEWRWYKLL